jgi:imidazolonepropionase-like amidohydrolase
MQAYRAARVIDGVSKRPLQNGTVVVDQSRIVSVEPHLRSTGDGVIDLGDATIMPGLIDAHVHLVWNAGREPHVLVEQESRYLTVLRCVENCRLHLRAGVTTVRDAGSTDAIAVAVARAIELGVAQGPRVLAAGRVVAMTGGHANVLGREADGVDGVRQAVRSEMKGGAHLIKLMASGGIYGHGEEVGSPQYAVEEMRAGVEEAHKGGRKVAAHAYSPRAIANALDAGVDSIEHASFLDEECAIRMRDSGTFMVPTLSTYEAMYKSGQKMDLPDYIVRKTSDVMVASRAAFALALKIGVPLATGTDAGAPGHPHGSLPEELRLMVEYGATALEAIRFATANSAELLGLASEIGTLEPGKRADILAVQGDPLQDIRVLKNVLFVLRDGAVVWRDSTRSERAWSTAI